MNKTRLFIMAMAAVVIAACTGNNKTAEDGGNISPASTGLQGEWQLDSYRTDSESTQFEAASNYTLSFNEQDNIFSLSTDCNMINGEFEITLDTIRFKNMLVTEMACENMIVEQNMLRLLNDSTAYATSNGDTIALISPYIGSAIFIRLDDKHSGN